MYSIKNCNVMKIKNFEIFENDLQDNVLDKMLDTPSSYGNLDRFDQYALKHGEEHPDRIEQNDRDERTYIGIWGVLEFVYDNHEEIESGREPDDDSTPKHPIFKINGTVLYKKEEYDGYLELGSSYVKVEFKNQNGEKFDPRKNEQHVKAMDTMFKEVLKDKLPRMEN